MSVLFVADSVLPRKAVAQTPPLRHFADLLPVPRGKSLIPFIMVSTLQRNPLVTSPTPSRHLQLYYRLWSYPLRLYFLLRFSNLILTVLVWFHPIFQGRLGGHQYALTHCSRRCHRTQKAHFFDPWVWYYFISLSYFMNLATNQSK